MRRNTGSAFVQLLDDLGTGDPVAWGFVGLFVVVAIGLGLFTLKIHRDFKREDEAKAKKYGRRF